VRATFGWLVGTLLIEGHKFIAILNHKPDLSRVCLELARAYFLDKNYPDATLHFETDQGWEYEYNSVDFLGSSSMKTVSHKTLIAAAVFACFSQPVLAEGVGVSAELGTTGVGVHVSVPVFRTLNARFGVNYFDYNTTGSTSDVDYKYKLKLNTIDALADWHPLENGFRLTAGVLWNGNKIEARAKANHGGKYEINGNEYDATDAGDLKGRISFNDIAPYVGIGWGNAPSKKGWSFSGDLGVIFQGSPSVSLKNRNCKLGATECSQLNDDLQVERKKLKDDVDGFQYYPVIRFGVGYRF